MEDIFEEYKKLVTLYFGKQGTGGVHKVLESVQFYSNYDMDYITIETRNTEQNGKFEVGLHRSYDYAEDQALVAYAHLVNVKNRLKDVTVFEEPEVEITELTLQDVADRMGVDVETLRIKE